MAEKKFNSDYPSREEWMKIIKDSLKQTSPEEITWQIDTQLSGPVFAHRDDNPLVAEPLQCKAMANNWKLGLCLNHDPELIKPLLDQAEILRFKNGESFFHENNFNSLPGQVILSFKNWASFQELIDEMDQDILIAHFEPYYKLIISTHQMPEVKEFSSICQFLETGVGKHGLELNLDCDDTSAVDKLTGFFASIIEWLHQSKASAEQISMFFNHLTVKHSVSGNILFEISLMRAVKIIYYNVQKALNVDVNNCSIHAKIDLQLLAEDQNDQLIKSTIAAVAAVIGGVEAMFIDPGHLEGEMNAMLISRMARNMQLIIKEESFIADVNDPVAGSYTIEGLSIKLAQRVWGNLADRFN